MTTTTTAPTLPPGPLMILRAAITLQAATAFAAAITAGLLLSVPGGKALHSATAYTLFGVTLAHVVVALLAWRPGGASLRPLGYAIAFFAATLVQVALGLAHLKALHVPFGVLVFGASLLEAVWIWRVRRGPAVGAG